MSGNINLKQTNFAGIFLALSDAPDSYAGEGSKIVAVNVAENALEFIVAPTGNGAAVPHPFLFLGY